MSDTKQRNTGPANRFVYAGLTALCLVCFAPVVTFDFFVMDDPVYIMNNPVVRQGLTLRGMWIILKDPFSVQLWMPLSLYSHMLDVELFGMNPGPHHAVNLLLHTINTLLLFAALRRLTGERVPSAMAAALFAVHPLHVEPVVWISSRKDLLSCLFFFMAMLQYAWYVKKPSRLQLGGIALTFLLGVSSKSMALTLPFVLLLLDYWPLRRGPDPFTDVPSKWRPWLALSREKSALFLVSLCTMFMSWYASRGSDVGSPGARYGLAERLKSVLAGYATYIAQSIWPRGMIPYYFHDPGGTPVWLAVLSGTGLLAVSIVVLVQRKSLPYLLVGWLWYGITLGPVSGILAIGSHSRADRYMYLPLVGLCIMVSWSLHAAARAHPRRRTPIAACAIAALTAFCAATIVQVQRWRDSESMLRYALAIEPNNPKLRETLGAIHLERGQVDAAIAEFARAVEVVPDSPGLVLRLADALMAAGRFPEAERTLQHLLALKPDSPVANVRMARNEAALGKRAEARERLRKVLSADPANAEARALLNQISE